MALSWYRRNFKTRFWDLGAEVPVSSAPSEPRASVVKVNMSPRNLALHGQRCKRNLELLHLNPAKEKNSWALLPPYLATWLNA